MLKPVFALLAASLMAGTALAAPVAEVSSPDGNIKVIVAIDNDGRPNYQISRNGKLLIAPSTLGFILTDSYNMVRGFTADGSETAKSDTTWEQPWGERRFVRDRLVSRALGVPCIVGCGAGALAALTGQVVTVDANEGRIYAGALPVVTPDESDDPRLAKLTAWAEAASPITVLREGAPEADAAFDLGAVEGGRGPVQGSPRRNRTRHQ